MTGLGGLLRPSGHPATHVALSHLGTDAAGADTRVADLGNFTKQLGVYKATGLATLPENYY